MALDWIVETVNENAAVCIRRGKMSSVWRESHHLTPPLQELLARSALPMQAIETVFAPDSSGFSVSKFVR